MAPLGSARRVWWTGLLGIALAATARAQDANAPKVAVAEPPAITLLLRAPRAFDEAALRKALARVLAREPAASKPEQGDGPWFTATADGGDGGHAGVAWRVRFVASPLALGDAALQHVNGEDRAPLAAHAAHVVVAAAAPCDATTERATYRALARVARALLGKDVVGIGCRAHGTFEPVDRDTAKTLMGDDPLAALAPTATTSIVVLLKQPFEFDEAKLIAIVQQELGVAIAADAGPEASSFVAVRPGMAILQVQGQPVILTMRKERAFATPANLELRLRKLVDEHTAVLHIAVFGAIADAAERARSRVLGRLVAGLWNDDSLVANWSADQALIPRSDDLLQNLRADDPVAATLGNGPVPVIAVPDGDAAMAAAIAEARRRFGEAETFFRGGGTLFVKFPFATRKGSEEHIWVKVQSIADGELKGLIGNEPVDVEGLRDGSAVTRKVSELSDWMFERDGKLEGGFSLKVLEDAAKKQQSSKPKDTGKR